MARSVPRSALRSCAHREAAGRCNSPATAAPGSGAASPSTGHPDSSRRPARRRSRGYDRSSPYMGCSKLRQGRSITENPTATTYIGFLEQQGYEDMTPEALAQDLAAGWPSASLWSDEAGLVVGGHGMGKDSVMRYLA